MGFLLRRLVAQGRWLALAAATATAGGVYGFLSTRDAIAPFGGAPHVIDWWEPYVWPAVAFVAVGKVLRMLLTRAAGAMAAGIERIRLGR